jgi:hypothetical protein
MAKKNAPTQTEAQTPDQTAAQPAEAVEPRGKVYYSKYRGYNFAQLVQFQGGRAEVHDPAVIARMEADPKFGIDFFAE